VTTITPLRAIVRDVFIVSGRGCAIVLENGFSGATRVGQAVKLGSQTVPVAAVEFVDTASESWVAIVVEEEHFALAKTHVGNEILEHL
jgi:UDP-3-O-[3-hydroxymyristoyl] glucosamine N-acyltransferase